MRPRASSTRRTGHDTPSRKGVLCEINKMLIPTGGLGGTSGQQKIIVFVLYYDDQFELIIGMREHIRGKRSVCTASRFSDLKKELYWRSHFNRGCEMVIMTMTYVLGKGGVIALGELVALFGVIMVILDPSVMVVPADNGAIDLGDG